MRITKEDLIFLLTKAKENGTLEHWSELAISYIEHLEQTLKEESNEQA